MKSARFLLLLVQVVCALLAAFGVGWALAFVIGAPVVAALIP